MLRWLVPVSSREVQVAIARHARDTRAKEARDLKKRKIKTNMAARGFFRARLLLSCFKRNSRISETVYTSTTLVNSLYSR